MYDISNFIYSTELENCIAWKLGSHRGMKCFPAQDLPHNKGAVPVPSLLHGH